MKNTKFKDNVGGALMMRKLLSGLLFPIRNKKELSEVHPKIVLFLQLMFPVHIAELSTGLKTIKMQFYSLF